MRSAAPVGYMDSEVLEFGSCGVGRVHVFPFHDLRRSPYSLSLLTAHLRLTLIFDIRAWRYWRLARRMLGWELVRGKTLVDDGGYDADDDLGAITCFVFASMTTPPCSPCPMCPV